MRAYSRQRERRVSAAAVVCGVSPGGKSLSREDELLYQASHEQLSLQPCSGTVLVDLLEVPELEQGFQPLEGQLNLPPPINHYEGRSHQPELGR